MLAGRPRTSRLWRCSVLGAGAALQYGQARLGGRTTFPGCGSPYLQRVTGKVTFSPEHFGSFVVRPGCQEVLRWFLLSL